MIAIPDETAAPETLADEGPARWWRALAWLLPIAATPVALVLPSRERHVSAGKVAVLSLAITTFFLFTGEYSFPGGAGQFVTFAQAIVDGTKLNASIAQRDIGYPLLLVLGGWTVWHSFIGITLIQAAFAASMPLLVYWSIVRVSPAVAYYAGIASALSFASILFMKWIHHDQAYIFFTLLVVALLANFVQTRRLVFLYLFTMAAVAASFTRPAGNLLFPILLIVAYLTARGRIVHYAACVAIVVATAAGYSWYRYQIFDMAHQPSPPSYTGEQVFYSLYINSGDFGIRLSPDVGPAMKHIDQALRQQLQPDLQRSAYVQSYLTQEPPTFANEAVLRYSPEALIGRIYDSPNWEYYALLAAADDDQLYVQASMEIARAHPQYVVQFVGRNLFHMLFQPGFAHTRYTTNAGLQKLRLDFFPAGANSAGIDQIPLGARGTAELRRDPLKELPVMVQDSFGNAASLWLQYFQFVLTSTSALIVIAWLAVLVRLVVLPLPRSAPARFLATPDINATVATTIAASTFLFYNALVTAAFAEPDYRYFLFTELLRVLVAACGVALVVQMLASWCKSLAPAERINRARRIAGAGISRVQALDPLARAFGTRPALLGLVIAALALGSFTAWAVFMGRTLRPDLAAPDTTQAVPEHNMTIDFTSGMRLDGWSRMDAQQAEPGGSVHLRLFWEAWSTPDFDYSAFLRLEGPNGFAFAGPDHGPGGQLNLLPHLWEPGTIVFDDWAISVPQDAPSGTYQLTVGVYDYRDLKPIPATDGLSALVIGSITL